MSVPTTTDPVAFVLAILDASQDADYANENGKPARVARSGDYSPEEKRRYEQDALYVYSIGEVNNQAFAGSGDAKLKNAQVGVDVWTLSGESVAWNIGEDVESIIDEYWTDNRSTTRWVTVRVTSENDYSHETFHDSTVGQHDRHLVTVTLMRDKSV
jgi:hypothetical protein